jgi:hypothetical protein
MFEYLQFIFDRPWKPLSRVAILAWLVFYAGFIAYAVSMQGGMLFIDAANMVVHEGGHNLFAFLGPTLMLWGGTILQWLVPLLLAIYFFYERQVAGFVFCLFFFFENWLYTSVYMADARDQALPLVTTGDPEFAEHDFFKIFSSLGVLQYDTKIASVVRTLGWLGMFACVIWLALRLRANDEQPIPVTFPKPAIPLAQRFPGDPRGFGQRKAGTNTPAFLSNAAGADATSNSASNAQSSTQSK